jgi:hypothetical protein
MRRRAPPRLPALRAAGSFRLSGPGRHRRNAPSTAHRAPPFRPRIAPHGRSPAQGHTYPLSAHTNRIGAGADADVVLPTDAALGVQAVIERTGDHALAIRPRRAAVGGAGEWRAARPEPTPLMHGDKVEVAGIELRFADETKRGATHYSSVEAIPQLGGARRMGAARAVAPSGGATGLTGRREGIRRPGEGSSDRARRGV